MPREKGEHLEALLIKAKTLRKKAMQACDNNNYDEALKSSDQCITIFESIASGGKNLAVCSNELAEVYSDRASIYDAMDNLKDALECFEQALALEEEVIRAETKASKVLSVEEIIENKENLKFTSLFLGFSSTLGDIGSVFYAQRELNKAMACYRRALAIQEHVDQDRLDIANSYYDITLVLQDQAERDPTKLDEAIAACEEALKIIKWQSLNDFDVAKFYRKLGELWEAKSKLGLNESVVFNKATAVEDIKKAVENYEKELEIIKAKEANSLEVASCYKKLGMLLKKVGDLEGALIYLQQSFAINEAKIPNHPKLILRAYSLAEMAFNLGKYDLAFEYIGKVLNKDAFFKYAYNLKGLILHKQGKLSDADFAFGRALICDPSYAEAILNKIEVLFELFSQVENKRVKLKHIKEKIKSIKAAKEVVETDYDQELIRRYKKEAEAANAGKLRDEEFPCQEYLVGSEKYLSRLDGLLSVFGELENEVPHVKIVLTKDQEKVEVVITSRSKRLEEGTLFCPSSSPCKDGGWIADFEKFEEIEARTVREKPTPDRRFSDESGATEEGDSSSADGSETEDPASQPVVTGTMEGLELQPSDSGTQSPGSQIDERKLEVKGGEQNPFMLRQFSDTSGGEERIASEARDVGEVEVRKTSSESEVKPDQNPKGKVNARNCCGCFS